MDMADIRDGGDGFPVLVAEFAAQAPGQVAAQPDSSGASVVRGASSGNANADPANGRFAPKDGSTSVDSSNANVSQQSKVNKPTTGDPVALARRRDLIMAAASQLAEMTMTSAGKWLEAFGVDTQQADVGMFLNEVRQMRIDLLVAAMAPTLRTTIDQRNQGNEIQLKAPKSWQKGMLKDLTDAEAIQLYQRLSGQGFDPGDVAKRLVNSVGDKKRREALQQVFGEPTGPSETKDQSEKK